MLVLRGHHLLCINFFRGKGYSADFVKNMKEIIEDFNKNPQQNIKLIAGGDSICRRCPNFANNRCTNGYNRVTERDKKVLQALGYQSGTIIQAGRVSDRVKQLLEEQGISHFCQHCDWYSLCSNYGV
ncbi:MAG: DUF1284 domain-containing protein [Halanaerobiales bacterium]